MPFCLFCFDFLALYVIVEFIFTCIFFIVFNSLLDYLFISSVGWRNRIR